MNRRIAAIGDSHAVRCFENHNIIADAKAYGGVNKLDGKTAHKLADHDKRVRKIISSLKSKHLIFCFGEVDVRIHFKYQHRKNGQPIETLIENTARRYIGYVSALKKEGFDIHVFNVVPTGSFTGRSYEGWKKKLAYPFLTDFTERRRFTLMLNKRKSYYCKLMGVPFIDIYKHLVDSRGIRRAELIYDFSHLNRNTADIVLKNYTFA